MNVHNILPHGDKSICAKFCMPMSKSKNNLAHTQIHNKNIKFKGRTDVMNVHDILSYGNTLLCQMSYDYVKGQKKMWLEHKAMSKIL